MSHLQNALIENNCNSGEKKNQSIDLKEVIYGNFAVQLVFSVSGF